MPTVNNRISVFVNEKLQESRRTFKNFELYDLIESIISMAETTRPIIHQDTKKAMEEYIDLMSRKGNKKYKDVFREITSVESYIDRLLKKRPLAFYGSSDKYKLQDGRSWYGGFEKIGTEDEVGKLILSNLISYDEMAFSALMSVSVPTYFINDGDRKNRGIIGAKNTYQEEGVYIGAVGARFEKPGYMEWRTCMITEEQNTKENGYGNRNNKVLNILADLYQLDKIIFGKYIFPTYNQAIRDKTNKDYIKIDNRSISDKTIIFNLKAYRRRIRLSLIPFLLDANQRGIEKGKEVYCYIVGLGLGAWQIKAIKDKQNREYVKILLDVLVELLDNGQISNISDIYIGHIPEAKYVLNKKIISERKFSIANNKVKLNGLNGSITIQSGKNNPAAKLTGDDENKLLVAENKLLVAMYAWDGNAFPGNEYWQGSLSASGDPAAACCSLIPQLQDPNVNTSLCGENMKVYPIQQNQQKISGGYRKRTRKTTKSTKTRKTTKSTKTRKTTKSTKTRKTTKSTKTGKTRKSTKSTKTSKSRKTTKSTKSTKTGKRTTTKRKTKKN